MNYRKNINFNDEILTVDQLVHQDDWVSDSERHRCHVCTRNFSSFRRKHHCRRCGEVVCRNCTLYKSAELPVIGLSRVRVCMSCILSQANSQNTKQSLPPQKRLSPSRAVDNNIHNSPRNSSEKSSDTIEINYQQFAYPLDFSWEHPWPKPPIISNEDERLALLNSLDILDTPAEDVFDIICDLASNALKCPIAAVSLITRDRQWFKANVGLAQNEIPRNVSFCAHTISSKEPLVVMDTTTDKRFMNNPLVTGAANIRFYAGAPICHKSGQIVGTVFVFDTKPRSSCDIATLEKLSNVAMKNIEDRKNAEAIPVRRTQQSVSPMAGNIPNNQTAHDTRVVSGENQLVKQAPVAEQQLVGGQRMEGMLMDLLCKTTETQQQLATQQGTMFKTLGQHTSQIDDLANAVARMEAKLESAGKLKPIDKS